MIRNSAGSRLVRSTGQSICSQGSAIGVLQSLLLIQDFLAKNIIAEGKKNIADDTNTVIIIPALKLSENSVGRSCPPEIHEEDKPEEGKVACWLPGTTDK